MFIKKFISNLVVFEKPAKIQLLFIKYRLLITFCFFDEEMKKGPLPVLATALGFFVLLRVLHSARRRRAESQTLTQEGGISTSSRSS